MYSQDRPRELPVYLDKTPTEWRSDWFRRCKSTNTEQLRGREKNFVTTTDLVEGPMRSQKWKKAKKKSCEVKSLSFKGWKKRSVVLKKI